MVSVRLALDAPVGVPAGVDRTELKKAIDGHVLKEAELHASYTRQG